MTLRVFEPTSIDGCLAESPMNSHDPMCADRQGSEAECPARRVLVVDDCRDARTILQLLLKKLGHLAETAEDGASGIAVSHEFRPEIVFCDITMAGGMSGYGFAEAARKDGTLGEACLVAVSGWEGSAHEQRAFDSGFDQVLKKPVGISELEQILRSPPRRSARK